MIYCTQCGPGALALLPRHSSSQLCVWVGTGRLAAGAILIFMTILSGYNTTPSPPGPLPGLLWLAGQVRWLGAVRPGGQTMPRRPQPRY